MRLVGDGAAMPPGPGPSAPGPVLARAGLRVRFDLDLTSRPESDFSRHRRAAPGKKPPPRRKPPPPRRLRLAASDPRTHDFPVHPSYLPSTHKFEFRRRFKPSGNLALINFKTSEDANRLRLLLRKQ